MSSDLHSQLAQRVEQCRRLRERITELEAENEELKKKPKPKKRITAWDDED